MFPVPLAHPRQRRRAGAPAHLRADAAQCSTAAKVRGVKLGNPKLEEARVPMLAAKRAQANAFARQVEPILAEARAAGATTLQALAVALTARGIRSPTGRRWGTSVSQEPARAPVGALTARSKLNSH